MKTMRFVILLISIVFVLAACAPVPVPVTGTASPSATKLPTTPVPTATKSITPLPTVPTFTPTFDARRMVTVTPAPKAECPKEDATISITIQRSYTDIDLDKEYRMKEGAFILDLLNKGLKITKLKAELDRQEVTSFYQDVTGDGVSDFFFSDTGLFYIFYCQAGHYQLFDKLLPDDERFDHYPIFLVDIADFNKNGIPELVTYERVMRRPNRWVFRIIEWDGENFVKVSLNPETGDDISVILIEKDENKDINQDGLTDLIFTGDGPWEQNFFARSKTVVYSWNGKFYSEAYVSFTAPQYRYQAIQDGDRETLYGNYQKAIAFYQAGIFNDKLEWQSLDRELYQFATDYSKDDKPTPTVYPTPVPDLNEYPRLAAYAYYRLITLHTHLGEMDAAQTQYATLQAKFPLGNPGHPYVEMASHFWDVYQSTGKMYNACAAAIAYADAHPEILTPLGSDYQSPQNHRYTPADVCPFR